MPFECLRSCLVCGYEKLDILANAILEVCLSTTYVEEELGWPKEIIWKQETLEKQGYATPD